MVLSYYDGITFSKGYEINKYWDKKLSDDSVLVTTEHGGWVVLNKTEFDLLRVDRVWTDPNLFKSLEDRGIIITQNNFNNIVKFYRNRFSHLFEGATLMIIAPTLRCNQSCVYCFPNARHLDSKGYDMDEETAKAVIDFIMQTPSKNLIIEIQGGEPLANFEIVQVLIDYANEVNKIAKKNIKFTMVTNLTLMDNDILKYLMNNLVGICTSLDGPKEVHDKNRKYNNGSGSYSDVVYWIDKIKKDHNYSINALPVTTKYSLPLSKEIIDEYVSHGLTTIRLKYVTEVGYAANQWSKIGYSPGEYIEFWMKGLNYVLHLNRKGININEGLTALILTKIIQIRNPGYTDLEFPCGAAIDQLAFTQDGDIHTCDEARSLDVFKLGSVFEDNYQGILKSKSVASILDISSGLSLLCDECVWKPFCGVCPVLSYSTTNNILPKLPSDFRCQVHSQMFAYIFKKIIFSRKDRDTLLKWINAPRNY